MDIFTTLAFIKLCFSDYNAISVDDTLDFPKYIMKKILKYKMFGFVKKAFAIIMIFLNFNFLNINISMKKQECKTRPKIIDVNNNEPVFYPYSIKVNKCSRSCNNNNGSMLNCVFLILLKT